MKTTLFLGVLFTGLMSFSATHVKSYSFQYSPHKSKTFSITQAAPTKEQAYKLAATQCFKKLTSNRYPGEEKGLEIIDICANPKM